MADTDVKIELRLPIGTCITTEALQGLLASDCPRDHDGYRKAICLAIVIGRQIERESREFVPDRGAQIQHEF